MGIHNAEIVTYLGLLIDTVCAAKQRPTLNIQDGSLFHRQIFLLAQLFLESRAQERDECEQIADHAVACYAKDGSFGILVDRRHQLGAADASDVLDGAGDARGDVQIG